MSNTNKTNNDSAWKIKVSRALGVCQTEIKKTTEIGRKMISASKTNTMIHEAYEELGRLTLKAIKDGDLDWDNLRVQKLIEQIDKKQKELRVFESEVKEIKKDNSN